jgi:hypothetical protein
MQRPLLMTSEEIRHGPERDDGGAIDSASMGDRDGDGISPPNDES